MQRPSYRILPESGPHRHPGSGDGGNGRFHRIHRQRTQPVPEPVADRDSPQVRMPNREFLPAGPGEPDTQIVIRHDLGGRKQNHKYGPVADPLVFEQLGHVLANRAAQAAGTTRQAALVDLRVLAGRQQSRWVHPTQLYDAIGLALLFVLLSVIFYHRRRHGLVVAWTLILYPVSRFSLELLRADNPRDVAGLTISQAISIAVLLVGLVYLAVLVKVLPRHSPRAVVAPS